MKRIKVIDGYGDEGLQENVDAWVKEINPNIVSTSLSKDGSYLSISIVYEDDPEGDILLKS